VSGVLRTLASILLGTTADGLRPAGSGALRFGGIGGGLGPGCGLRPGGGR
jgi:hypothetical protein